ncbi:hypothetical protein LP7551_05401 [Roseibium album]|nr:hypothetical protein LP7551_05401 [Roseibium album]
MNSEILLTSRERNARRRLVNIGYRLHKTPARSWLRADYGLGYMIVDERNSVVFGCWYREFQATLEEVEAFIEAEVHSANKD